MLKIETLGRDHDRSGFDCGNDALNQYVGKIARQHLNKGISRTFVLVDEKMPTGILGFFTLASCEIYVEKLPRKYAKKYPSRVPAAKLARLAVAKERQRQGLGTHMMIDAIERVIRVSQNLGIVGFFVDAKDNEAKAYYEQFGFIPLPDNPLELFLPLATLQNAYDMISKA
ncbi:MAG: GNAT family N-acetyltransferase [Deltaproteobacteria bacterium]|nr:GNAT family N-acetyltransferase [Deltaproteobacteria bacterium]MBW1909080.1 GNAT family N-acetyltransferase [Deltaproteobacteria bacterium]MBW2034517.1 GNAT family N-acetyltransferase [Deltaproteobacteria bacterium]MBW2114827.1 GNAT family N-acetyltransferase [Deltaproteobacteria bacterium]